MRSLCAAIGILALALAAPAGRCQTYTATQTLTAVIAPVAKLSLPATVTLTAGAVQFSSYQNTVTVSYRARTTSGGGGTVTLQVTTDFSPLGGPRVANGALTYSCAGATLGSACNGTQTASTTAQTPVLALPASACTGGGGACSSADPNSVILTLSVPDDPTFATGSYTASLRLVISAT